MADNTIGQRIAAKRSKLGMSQSALGEQLGVSRQSVFKWESDAAIPEIDKLITLSRLFGVSVDWLLGIGETPEADPREETPREGAPRDFTPREREILEQLSRQKPASPRWQKWLAAGTAVCAVLALTLSGLAFHKWNQASRAMEETKAQIAEFAAQLQLLNQANVVKDFDYGCVPTADLSGAEVWMRVTPYAYQDGAQASLTVLLGEEVMHISNCTWNGASWETEFDLNAASGYRFLFRLTDAAGSEFTQELSAPILYQLGLNLAWPTDYAVTWKELEEENGSLSFTDMTVDIPLPGVFRTADQVWQKCDLVLKKEDGTELARFDLMHRSQYSAQIDFSGSDVRFTARTVELTFPALSTGETMSLELECKLTTGHTFLCPVEVWKMTADGISANFNQARD